MRLQRLWVQLLKIPWPCALERTSPVAPPSPSKVTLEPYSRADVCEKAKCCVQNLHHVLLSNRMACVLSGRVYAHHIASLQGALVF